MLSFPVLFILKKNDEKPLLESFDSILGLKRFTVFPYNTIYGYSFYFIPRDSYMELSKSFTDLNQPYLLIVRLRYLLPTIMAFCLFNLQILFLARLLYHYLFFNKEKIRKLICGLAKNNLLEYCYEPGVDLEKDQFTVNGYLVEKENIIFNSNLGDKVCIFAHYDSRSFLHDYVKEYLKKIKNAGFDIVFVTTCEEVPDKVYLKNVVDIVFHRKNIGHDFMSWQSFLLPHRHKIEGKQLLLTNDSVFVDPSKIDRVFNDLNAHEFDIYGGTRSFHFAEHLQSYFLYFKENVTSTKDFWSFWEEYPCPLVKDLVVEYGEIALSQYFISKGYKLKSYLNTEYTINNCSNPVYDCGVELLKEYDYPFLKKQLVLHQLSKKGSKLGAVIVEGKYQGFLFPLIQSYLKCENK